MNRLLILLFTLLALPLMAQEKVGINTGTPETTLDIRSLNDVNGAANIQLATPSKSNWLTLFAGHQTDPRPFMFFSNLDTFRIATGNDDYSGFTEHFAMLPDGKIGINMLNGAYSGITDIFQVFADDTVTTTSSIIVNTVIDLPAAITPSVSFGQSFIAEQDATLNSFNFTAQCNSGGSADVQYSIRSGSADGAVLASGTIAISGASYTSYEENGLAVNVTNGSTYYLRLDHSSGDNVDWGISVNDTYLPGAAYSNQEGPWTMFGTNDLACAFTFIGEEVMNLPIFSVENEARVRVHDYLLPAFDGLPGEVMTTNGSGELSWSNVSGGGGGSGGAFVNNANLIRHTGDQLTDDFIFGDTAILNPTLTSFFFDKSKGAFRIGFPDIASQPANVGDFTFASGMNVLASGQGSMAVGKDLTATGDYSTALGEGNKSSGNNSLASGLGSTSAGMNSFAVGDTTFAYARNSVAHGQQSIAFGINSLSGGSFSTNNGENAFTFGDHTEASANNSASFGSYTKANSFGAFAVGMNNHPIVLAPTNDLQGNHPMFMVGNGETNDIEDWSNAMTVLFNGNTGLGLNDPITTLHINDNTPHLTLEATGGVPILQFTNDNDPGLNDDWIMYSLFSGSGSFRLEQDGMKRMVIDGAGNMALGDIEPQTGFRLAVQGSVLAEEVMVALEADWPDYVFSEEYELMSLEKTEDFINQNHHLPNIPDAEAVKNEGLEIGEMQRKMMEKIEELTLHIIELNKRIKELESNQKSEK